MEALQSVKKCPRLAMKDTPRTGVRRGGANSEDEDIIIGVHSIVSALASSGFVTAKEILALSQASKQANQSCMDDTAVWLSLCNLRWPFTKSLPRTFVEKLSATAPCGRYQHLYKQWNGGVASPGNPEMKPLDPPSCTAEDLTVFVHLAYKGTPLVSLELTGDFMLRPLLENGRLEVALNDPVVLGKAVWDFSQYDVDHFGDYEYGLGVKVLGVDFTAFEANLHCFRKNDVTLCCLCRSTRPGSSFFAAQGTGGIHPLLPPGQGKEAISTSCDFDFSKPHIFSRLYFPKGNDWQEGERQVLGLRQSPMATEIWTRLKHLVFFQVRVTLNIVEPNQVALCAIGITAHHDEYDEHGSPASHFAGTCDGVSLLHILSELRGLP